MIGLKKLFSIVVIITGILLPILIFKNWKLFLVDFVIFIFSALTYKIVKITMNEKIINDEYRNRFEK